MAKKLSKKKAEVWDRLKNGLPPKADTFGNFVEEQIVAVLAKGMADEIDKEILDTLLKIHGASKR